jgi:2,4-dienoyl-CoA reductase-like NADH-dependent reductase (Old Yellow Enzyme family)
MLALFEAAGVSIIHASTRKFWAPEWPGSDLSLAGWCKRLSKLPVITVGSVGVVPDGGDAAEQIKESVGELVRRRNAREFDLVSVGRSQIADPNWVDKVRSAAFDLIRPFQEGDTRRDDDELAASAASYPLPPAVERA